MKYYFYHTVKDGSKNRLQPLPFQTASDGSPIMQKLNTQVAAGGMKLRETYPIGTVFCSAMCELSARGGTPYYCAGDIYPILTGNTSYEYSLPMPTKEMLDAYEEYRKNTSTSDLSIDSRREALESEGLPAIKIEIILNNLMEIQEKMKQGIASFTFQKSDGSIRHAIGTLVSTIVDRFYTPSGKESNKAPNRNLVTYFDLDKHEWRSFSLARLLSCDNDDYGY